MTNRLQDKQIDWQMDKQIDTQMDTKKVYWLIFYK